MPDAASKVDGSNFGSIRNATNSCPPKEYCRILIVGCGSSRLGEDMMKDGWGWMVEKPEPYKNGGERSAVVPGITNVDFSEVVIAQMEQRANCSFYRTVQAKFNRWTLTVRSLARKSPRSKTTWQASNTGGWQNWTLPHSQRHKPRSTWRRFSSSRAILLS